MTVVSTIFVVAFYAALLLLSVFVSVPNHGPVLTYVVSQLGFWTGFLAIGLLAAPVALLTMVQYQTNRLQKSDFANEKLKADSQRLVLSLGEIGKMQLAISRAAAVAKDDTMSITQMDSLAAALTLAEDDVGAVEKLLADPSQYKVLIDGLRDRQAAVAAKVATANAVIRPLKDASEVLTANLETVRELLEKLGGVDEIAALVEEVAEAEKFVTETTTGIAKAEGLTGPVARQISVLESLKERLEVLTDEDDGLSVRLDNIEELVETVRTMARRADLTESGEPVVIRLAAAETAAKVVAQRIVDVEKLVPQIQFLRATLEQAKVRVKNMNDEHGMASVMKRIEEAIATLEKTLRPLEFNERGEKFAEVVARYQGEQEHIKVRVKAAEELILKVVGLRSDLDKLSGHIGAKPNGEARTNT